MAEALKKLNFEIEVVTDLDGGHFLGTLGEGFRMPIGVRKPPKHERAGLRQLSMGISGFARAR